MIYSIKMSFKKIWRHKFLYMIVILQILFGVNILASALDDYFVKMGDYKESVSDLSEYNINIVAQDENSSDSIDSIKMEDYKKVKSQYESNLNMNLKLRFQFTYALMQDNEFGIYQSNMIFVDSDYWGLNIRNDQVYIGEDIYHQIKKITEMKKIIKSSGPLGNNEYMTHPDLIVGIEGDILNIDGKSYNILVMDKKLQNQEIYPISSSDKDDKIKVADVIMFSHEAVKDFDSYMSTEDLQHLSKFAKLEVQENKPGTTYLYDMINKLQEYSGGRYQFYTDNQYLIRKETLLHKLGWAINRMAIAITQLFLVTVSTTGIIYLIILRRKKSIAIAIMNGSTKARQILELLLEVYAVCLAGVLFGMVSYYILNQRSENIMNHGTILAAFLVWVVMGFLSSSLSLKGIKNLLPIEILQRN